MHIRWIGVVLLLLIAFGKKDYTATIFLEVLSLIGEQSPIFMQQLEIEFGAK